MAASQEERPKDRRNITLDRELNEWLKQQENASLLIADLLMAYRAYGTREEAVEWTAEKRQQYGG